MALRGINHVSVIPGYCGCLSRPAKLFTPFSDTLACPELPPVHSQPAAVKR
jgi:hypothetical protein